jgi:hypothetical protein
MSATSLSLDDLVLDPARYAALRPGVRAEAIALRRQRRVHVGDLVVLEFEDARTLGTVKRRKCTE